MKPKVEGPVRILADQMDSVDHFLGYLSERSPPQDGSMLAKEQDDLVSWVRDELVQIRGSLNAALVVLKRWS